MASSHHCSSNLHAHHQPHPEATHLGRPCSTDSLEEYDPLPSSSKEANPHDFQQVNGRETNGGPVALGNTTQPGQRQLQINRTAWGSRDLCWVQTAQTSLLPLCFCWSGNGRKQATLRLQELRQGPCADGGVLCPDSAGSPPPETPVPAGFRHWKPSKSYGRTLCPF